MKKSAAFLTVKASFMTFVILFFGIGLAPDEAQYWTWSQNLDWGYYSKPPGIAWQIFLGASLLGSTELGVRITAVVLGTLFALAVYFLARKADLDETSSFFALLLAALTPLGFFSTFLTITDGGLLLFWTLALIEVVKGFDREVSLIKVGFYLAFGALFKWPIYLFWIVVALFYLVTKKMPPWKPLFLGVALSFLGLLPTLYWNYHHDWVTFKHVFITVQGGSEGVGKPNPLDFLGSQIAIISPVLFFMLIYAWFSIRKVKIPKIHFLGLTSLLFFALYVGYSFFKKGQGNWALFLYPGAFVYLAAFFQEKKNLLKLGLLVSVLLTCFVFLLPTLQKTFDQTWFWKINPFKHNLGWNFLSDHLKTDRFLFSDKYQTTSEISFYNPSQQRAYFFNFQNLRKNQFSFWPLPQKQNGLFVQVENGPDLEAKLEKMKTFYQKALSTYFANIGEGRVIPLVIVGGELKRAALLIPCNGWNGKVPEDPEKF